MPTQLAAAAEATCYPALPAPVLTITGTENYTDFFGTPYTRYKLNVTNYESFPAELFDPAPSLPACGLNTNSSRTWVDIFVDGSHYYGFCGLASPSDLNRIWFAVQEGGTPPNSAYITLTDRQCGISYTSNVVPDTYGPVTTDVLITPNPAAVPTPGIILAATVNETTTGRSNITSAQYRIDAAPWTDMTVQDGFDSPVEYVTAILGSFATPDVKEVCVHGTDAVGNTGPDSCVLLALYDPNAGFATGGGWIDSPAGAYVGDPSLTGRADFGFVSQYKHGATVPTGNTEFQFRVATLKFKSTSYDWLVVAGAKAQYKGTGTINDSGNFRFLLTAVDGQLVGSGGVDKFRIKIWDDSGGIYYDNQINDPDTATPTTVLSGGRIVIHK